MLLFYTRVKHQKTYRFHDVFMKSNSELKWVNVFLLSDHSNVKEHSEVVLYMCSTKNIHRRTKPQIFELIEHKDSIFHSEHSSNLCFSDKQNLCEIDQKDGKITSTNFAKRNLWSVNALTVIQSVYISKVLIEKRIFLIVFLSIWNFMQIGLKHWIFPEVLFQAATDSTDVWLGSWKKSMMELFNLMFDSVPNPCLR